VGLAALETSENVLPEPVWATLARVSMQMRLHGQEYAKALEECELYLKRIPNDVEVLTWKARALRGLGREVEGQAAEKAGGRARRERLIHERRARYFKPLDDR
jgi:hypothetical protein